MSKNMSDMKNGRYEEKDLKKISWYRNGVLHRENGPAVECENGEKHWFIDGKHHRDDGPAQIWSNIDYWFTHGKIPTNVEDLGIRIEYSMYWFIEDKLHREDGPAIELSDETKEWYLNGCELTEEEFNQWLEKKSLNEKLHTKLVPKPIIKRNKI